MQEGSNQNPEDGLLAAGPDRQVHVRIIFERVDGRGQRRIDLWNGLDPYRIFISVSVVSVMSSFCSGALLRVFSARGRTSSAGRRGHRFEVDAWEGTPASFGTRRISALSARFGFDATVTSTRKAGAGGWVITVLGAKERINRKTTFNYLKVDEQLILKLFINNRQQKRIIWHSNIRVLIIWRCIQIRWCKSTKNLRNKSPELFIVCECKFGKNRK